MSRQIWRLIDVDATFSLELEGKGGVNPETLVDPVSGRKMKDEFYVLKGNSYNKPLLAALIATHTPTSNTSLYSTVEMSQVDYLSNFSGQTASWHVQRNITRLRFHELLVQAQLNPQGLVSTSSILHESPYAEGDIVMRHELLTAQERKVPLPVSDSTKHKFTSDYNFGEESHKESVKSDVLNSFFMRIFLQYAIENDETKLTLDLIQKICNDRAYFDIYEAVGNTLALSPIFTQQSLLTQEDLANWAMQAINASGGAYLNNLNCTLSFFNQITWPPGDTKLNTVQDRVEFFTSGKGHMLAHLLLHIPDGDVVQIFDDKLQVIKLASILIQDCNKHLLGNRRLVALQVGDKQPYHSEYFYRSVLEHTQSSLVLTPGKTREFLQEWVAIWQPQPESVHIKQLEKHFSEARYVICPLADDQNNTVVLYDALEDNYYRYGNKNRTQQQTIDIITHNPQQYAQNTLTVRCNRAWEKTFNIPRDVRMSRAERWRHHYLGKPKSPVPWYTGARYVLGGFVCTPIVSILKCTLELPLRLMECVLARIFHHNFLTA